MAAPLELAIAVQAEIVGVRRLLIVQDRQSQDLFLLAEGLDQILISCSHFQMRKAHIAMQ